MNLAELFDVELCARLALALLHSLWQGVLIAAVAAGLMWLLRRRPAQLRYLASCVALCLLAVCLPVNYAVLTQWNIPAAGDTSHPTIPEVLPAHEVPVIVPIAEVPAASPPDAPFAESLVVTSPVELPPDETHSAAAADLQDLSERRQHPVETASLESSAATGPDWRAWSQWILVGYAAGVIVMLLRLAAALYGSQRLRGRYAQPVARPLMESLQRCVQRAGLRVGPVLAQCARVTSPVVVGVLKPMILLPVSFATELTGEQIETILLHELAHLRRYDHIANFVQRVLEAFLFYHPAAWWLSHRISAEREHGCDELVLRWGGEACAYAEAIVRLSELRERSRIRHPRQTAALAAAEEHPSRLRARVLRILGEPEAGPQIGVTRRGAGVTALFVVGMCVLAFSTQKSKAQNDPQSQAPMLQLADEVEAVQPKEVESPEAAVIAPATNDWSAPKPQELIVELIQPELGTRKGELTYWLNYREVAPEDFAPAIKRWREAYADVSVVDLKLRVLATRNVTFQSLTSALDAIRAAGLKATTGPVATERILVFPRAAGTCIVHGRLGEEFLPDMEDSFCAYLRNRKAGVNDHAGIYAPSLREGDRWDAEAATFECMLPFQRNEKFEVRNLPTAGDALFCAFAMLPDEWRTGEERFPQVSFMPHESEAVILGPRDRLRPLPEMLVRTALPLLNTFGDFAIARRTLKVGDEIHVPVTRGVTRPWEFDLDAEKRPDNLITANAIWDFDESRGILYGRRMTIQEVPPEIADHITPRTLVDGLSSPVAQKAFDTLRGARTRPLTRLLEHDGDGAIDRRFYFRTWDGKVGVLRARVINAVPQFSYQLLEHGIAPAAEPIAQPEAPRRESVQAPPPPIVPRVPQSPGRRQAEDLIPPVLVRLTGPPGGDLPVAVNLDTGELVPNVGQHVDGGLAELREAGVGLYQRDRRGGIESIAKLDLQFSLVGPEVWSVGPSDVSRLWSEKSTFPRGVEFPGPEPRFLLYRTVNGTVGLLHFVSAQDDPDLSRSPENVKVQIRVLSAGSQPAQTPRKPAPVLQERVLGFRGDTIDDTLRLASGMTFAHDPERGPLEGSRIANEGTAGDIEMKGRGLLFVPIAEGLSASRAEILAAVSAMDQPNGSRSAALPPAGRAMAYRTADNLAGVLEWSIQSDALAGRVVVRYTTITLSDDELRSTAILAVNEAVVRTLGQDGASFPSQLDLDTGRLIANTQLSSINPIAPLASAGVDLVHDRMLHSRTPGTLVGLEIKVSPLGEGGWSLPNDQLLGRVQGFADRDRLDYQLLGPAPAVYLFQTRTGAVGVLEFQKVEEGPAAPNNRIANVRLRVLSREPQPAPVPPNNAALVPGRVQFGLLRRSRVMYGGTREVVGFDFESRERIYPAPGKVGMSQGQLRAAGTDLFSYSVGASSLVNLMDAVVVRLQEGEFDLSADAILQRIAQTSADESAREEEVAMPQGPDGIALRTREGTVVVLRPVARDRHRFLLDRGFDFEYKVIEPSSAE